MKTLPVSVVAGLEAVVNRMAALDPDLAPKIKALQGKIVAIEVSDIPLNLFMLFGSDGRIRLMSRYDNDVEARIRGSSLALSRLGLSASPNKHLLSGAVSIEGEVETAGQVRAILASLNIDWEEQLSKLTGDIIAHQVGNTLRAAIKWGTEAVESLQDSASEYIRYELQYTPSQADLDNYIQAVDKLRNDLDRAAARVERLLQAAEHPVKDDLGAKN